MNYLKLFAVATFAVGAILYLAGADDHAVVVGEQTYEMGDYSKITLNARADVTVAVGPEYSLTIKADEEDAANLRIYVRGQTLVIEKQDGAPRGWVGDRVEISLTTPHLQKFTMNGSPDARITGIDAKSFVAVMNGSGHIDFEGKSADLKVEVNGSGDVTSKSYDVKDAKVVVNGSGKVTLAGHCGWIGVKIHGSGDIMARKLACEKADVKIVGSGDADIHAAREVDVEVMGSGDVNIYGNPKQVTDNSRKTGRVAVH